MEYQRRVRELMVKKTEERVSKILYNREEKNKVMIKT